MCDLHRKPENSAAADGRFPAVLHGVGASVVNALSEWMEAEVSRDGKVYSMKFARGDMTQKLKEIGKRAKAGTKITFKPDPDMFPDTNFDFERIIVRCRELAFLNEGLAFFIEDERTGKKEEFKYSKGIIQYVKQLNEGKEPLHPVIYLEKEEEGKETPMTVAIALQYNDPDAARKRLHSFANNINTPGGGTHLSGFKTGACHPHLESIRQEQCRER